jgi:lipopolysaccharide/colanic/teichoic acid biosynthesis glycosyltransferase
VQNKGYLDLFEAFKAVLKVFPKTILLSIGQEEPDKKNAIDLKIVADYGIKKNVIFLGERNDVDQIYPLMDVFTLPSHGEGMSVSVLEAMAEKRAIAVTDIRGSREEIENGKTGILVPVKNPPELSKAILFLLGNEQKAHEMATCSRCRAEKEFDEKLVFGRIEDSYRELMEKKLDVKNNKKIFWWAIKRIFDIVSSFLGLALLSPVIFLVAVLIKIDSAGSVFFKYERAGKNGKSFYPVKFRTMISGAINKGLGYTVSKDDERITKVGKFLRKWGIDEIPQLINVFLGEMSIVGPRPTFRYQVEKYTDFEKRRLLVKPGLAGWAIVHGRNSLTWPERIKYDVWYVDNWSFWLDIKIIFKTLYEIFIKQEGVYGKEGINDLFIR